MKAIIAFSAAMSLFVVAPIAFMLADNQPPYEYDAADSYVVPLTTQAGHQMTVHWSIRVNRVCPGLITRNVVDVSTGVRTTYVAMPAAQSPKLGDRTLDREFLLPLNITSGKKLYYADGLYHCNLVQRYWSPLIVRTPQLSFEILPP